MRKQDTECGLCGECRHHRCEGRQPKSRRDWHCENPRSSYYMDYTDYADSCDDWEGKDW